MLWIILAIALFWEFYYGVELFEEIIFYIVYNLNPHVTYLHDRLNNDNEIICRWTVQFDIYKLSYFITSSIICILIVLLVLLLIHFLRYKEETIETKTLSEINIETATYYVIESIEFFTFYYLMDDGSVYKKNVDVDDVFINKENSIH